MHMQVPMRPRPNMREPLRTRRSDWGAWVNGYKQKGGRVDFFKMYVEVDRKKGPLANG